MGYFHIKFMPLKRFKNLRQKGDSARNFYVHSISWGF